MREIALSADTRSRTGKGGARETRRDGKIPGVVYGPEIDPVSISVDERTFRAVMKGAGRTSVVNLSVDGKENKVLIRELQRDPVTSRIVHVDFHAISMDKPINVEVPIHFFGEPPGVKAGGIMQTTLRELEISCLPAAIPDSIEVDVSELEIGDSVHVRDLSLPNVEVLTEERRTVVVIAAPTVIKSTAAEEAEGEEGEEGEGAEGAAEGAEGEEGEKKAEEGKPDEKKPE
jgi:large subunit ribosomal protein L25